MAAKGIYQRGAFWLDYDRGAGGVAKNNWLYICWYDRLKGRICRKSTREQDVRLASDQLDRHYLAVHRPSEFDKNHYSVSESLTDYWIEHGSKVVSSDAIKARLKLITRFIDYEVAAGRLVDPFLPEQVDDQFIRRFREWAVADPIIALKKNGTSWVESSRRPRTPSTVEESVIQLKAALNYAKKAKRTRFAPDFEHKTRAQVTPVRNDRLSLQKIADLLNFTMEGCGKYSGHADRLLPLRRYVIAAICTVARPDAILDMSVNALRGQWHQDAQLFDLNPNGRIQTKKYRAVIPVTSLLNEWLHSTDEWFVCGVRNVGTKANPVLIQSRVASVKSAWGTARDTLGLPAGWGPKLLRHSIATILANRGVPQTERKLIMGHEALEGSQKAYIIFEPGYLSGVRDVLEQLTEELRGLSPGALSAPLLAPPKQDFQKEKPNGQVRI